MKRKLLLSLGILTTLSLTGCRSGSSDAENEALREQISQLQQQVSDLEQQITSENNFSEPEAADNSPKATEDDGTNETTPATDPESGSASGNSAMLSTTHTMDELTGMVADYEEKTAAAVSSGSASDDMEQFMALKQEEKQIDQNLDLHEDELEYLYRNNSLSREEYKTMERELERLEDRLDAAEDTLEYVFGIDD